MCFGMVLLVEDDNLAMIREWKAKGMKHFNLRPNYLCYTGWLMHDKMKGSVRVMQRGSTYFLKGPHGFPAKVSILCKLLQDTTTHSPSYLIM